jgi:hypothetical protein
MVEADGGDWVWVVPGDGREDQDEEEGFERLSRLQKLTPQTPLILFRLAAVFCESVRALLNGIIQRTEQISHCLRPCVEVVKRFFANV